jgi:hypothetical protein
VASALITVLVRGVVFIDLTFWKETLGVDGKPFSHPGAIITRVRASGQRFSRKRYLTVVTTSQARTGTGCGTVKGT